LMMADCDDIAVLQSMLLNQLAIDVRAIGAVQILEKRIVENIDDQGVVSTNGWIVDAHIIVREAPNRVTLLAHVVFSQDLIVQAQN